MGVYLLKRVFFFVPTLLIISLMAFFISANSPLDPVRSSNTDDIVRPPSENNDTYTQDLKKFNLHLPLFYAGISNMSLPDTLFRIYDKSRKESMERQTDQYGNWPDIQAYQQSISRLIHAHANIKVDTALYKGDQHYEFINKRRESLEFCTRLKYTSKHEVIKNLFEEISLLHSQNNFLNVVEPEFLAVKRAYDQVQIGQTRWKTYVPRIVFFGLENQYHKWISGVVTRFDFGISYYNKLPVSLNFKHKIFWSAFLAIFSMLIAYLISIPLGVLMAVYHKSRFDRISGMVVFAMYSLPSFFVATLLLIFFANPDLLQIFPSSFNTILGPDRDTSLMAQFFRNLHRLILPLIAYTYGSIAFLSRSVRASMLETLQQDFIRTARAKGLPEKIIMMKHALKNSLLPAITVFANIFPAAIGGSVILESIFGIPGMGLATFNAVYQLDIPMIVAIFSISGFLTILGYLVSDLLYAWVDPRISFDR